jgi:N-carbamoylputrescine amidase
MTSRSLRIALLHLDPVPGDLAHNRLAVETAVATAAQLGASWILTPELCVCGYSFAGRIGTDWIARQPGPWLMDFCRRVGLLHVTVFLSHPERDLQTGQLHNTVFVIGPSGRILGKHRKINALRGGAEDWSSPGTQAVPIPVPPLGKVGILICADACSPGIAASLKSRGAGLIVSSASWAPGAHGPSGEWEARTRETGLPLLVCNRTGIDGSLDFTDAESVVVKDGLRILSARSARPVIITLDWDAGAGDLASPEARMTDLQGRPERKVEARRHAAEPTRG